MTRKPSRRGTTASEQSIMAVYSQPTNYRAQQIGQVNQIYGQVGGARESHVGLQETLGDRNRSKRNVGGMGSRESFFQCAFYC
jgi:hypothetical protein